MVPNRHEAKRVVYRFYATTEGVPRRLDMRGQNSLSEAHLDHWVNRILCLETAPRQLGNWAECTCAAAANCGLPACLLAVMLGGSVSDASTCTLNLPAPWQVVDYTHFVPGRPAASLFHTPELCKSVAPQTLPTGRRTARQTRLLSLVPTVRYRGDTEVRASPGQKKQDLRLNRRNSGVNARRAAVALQGPQAWEASLFVDLACMVANCGACRASAPYFCRSIPCSTMLSFPVHTALDAAMRPWQTTSTGRRFSEPTCA